MKTVFQIINTAGFVVFGYFASLQLDDANPEVYYHASSLDAYLWLAFYILIAAVFLFALFGGARWWMVWVGAGFCAVQLVMTWPGFVENVGMGKEFTLMGSQMSPSRPRVELSREFLGALMALVGTGLVGWQLWRKPVAGDGDAGDAQGMGGAR